MISLDCETTGLDIFHGARPFLVTTCNEAGENTFWEAEVDPLTRMPDWSAEDLDEIRETIASADAIVGQNIKFDVGALRSIGIVDWPWEKTFDALIAGHLLASSQPHDLTTMALVYLNINIEPFEDRLVEAVKEARSLVRSWYPDWRIAKSSLPEMPSAKEKCHRYDYWLPRAYARAVEHDEYDWLTVCSDYANSDSAVTLPLFQEQERLLKKRGLWKIYEARLKVLPIASKMEKQGVYLSKTRKDDLTTRLTTEADECHRKCLALADGELEELPVNGVSNALRTVIFDKFKLESPKATPSGAASMDKSVLTHWLDVLPERSRSRSFVANMLDYRRRKTSISYMESYERFWLPMEKYADFYRMHPFLNPTGTVTLRWTSQGPNEQQISKQEGVNLRYCFGPPPGYEWYSLDAENIELRIPAYEANETAMIALFEKPHEPPYFGSNHLFFFDILHPDKWDRSDPEGLLKAKKKYASTWYQWTKNGDFAVQYGAVAESGTADRAYHVEGGQAKIEKRLSNIKKLSQSLINFADRYGYVETMPDKTVDPKQGYPLECKRTKWGRVLPTVPLSYHVQGTAMWWMMKAMFRCDEEIQQWNRDGFDASIVMQVHDELVFQMPIRKGNEHRARRLKLLMEQGGDDIGVPTPVKIERHSSNWAEGETLKT